MILEVCADAYEELRLIELVAVKKTKYDKYFPTWNYSNRVLELVMFFIPSSTKLRCLVWKLIKDQVVLDIKGEIVIVLK